MENNRNSNCGWFLSFFQIHIKSYHPCSFLSVEEVTHWGFLLSSKKILLVHHEGKPKPPANNNHLSNVKSTVILCIITSIKNKTKLLMKLYGPNLQFFFKQWFNYFIRPCKKIITCKSSCHPTPLIIKYS